MECVKKHCEIYISPNGDDNHTGSYDAPFRTIERTRDYIREHRLADRQNVIVYLREGTYYLKSTLRFDENDSGRNSNYITYKNYPGETPVISGGYQVTGWTKCGKRGNYEMWKAEVPYVENTRQLYIDNKRMVRARSTPIQSGAWEKLNDPDMQFHNLLEEFVGIRGVILNIYEGYKTSRKEMLSWKNINNIEFVFDVGWTHSICPLDQIIALDDGAFIKMKMPCFRDCQLKGGVQVGSPNYIENAFELLDEPGEWYFDPSERIIYYIPTEGQCMEQVNAIIPVVERLVAFVGNLERHISFIRFEGITFAYSTWLRPGQEGHPEVQANLLKSPVSDKILHSNYIKIPSAFVIDAAEFIELRNCIFKHLGSGALDIQHGSSHIQVLGNEFFDIAATGIQVGDFNMEDAHPEDERNIVREIVIDNNYLHHIGEEYKGSTAINAGYVQDILITHNEICYVAYTGISMGWGWGYWDMDSNIKKPRFTVPEYYPRFQIPTVLKNNRIEYNHIYQVMQKMHDGGGIYTLSLQPGSAIRWNMLHDNGMPDSPDNAGNNFSAKGWPGGIYQDEASGGYEVTGNIVYNVPQAYFYNDVGIPGRSETVNEHDNYFYIKPGEEGFPDSLARQIGRKK
jgi:hypothetical protein